MIYWIIQTIPIHIIAQYSLAGGGKSVGVDEAAGFGVVVSALEVIGFCFRVVDIATVAEGVILAEGGCHGACAGLFVAPGIVGVADHRASAAIQNGYNIPLQIGCIVVGGTVIGHSHGTAGRVIGKVQRVGGACGLPIGGSLRDHRPLAQTSASPVILRSAATKNLRGIGHPEILRLRSG